MPIEIKTTRFGKIIQNNTNSYTAPTPVLAWSVPKNFSNTNNILNITLEKATSTGRTGIRIQPVGTLPCQTSSIISLQHACYQGSAPSLLQWDVIQIANQNFSIYLDSPLPNATHLFYLREITTNGQIVNYSQQSITTPVDPTLGMAIGGISMGDNLIPNWTSELGIIPGIGSNGVYDTTQGGTQTPDGFNGTSWVRAINTSGAWNYNTQSFSSMTKIDLNKITDIPIDQSDNYMCAYAFKRLTGGDNNSTDALYIQFSWFDNLGNPITYTSGGQTYALHNGIGGSILTGNQWVQEGIGTTAFGPKQLAKNYNYTLSAIAAYVQLSIIVVGSAQWYVDNIAMKRVVVPNVATSSTPGTVIPGAGLQVGSDGTLSHTPATASSIGGIKVGSGLTIGTDGTLSTSGGGSSSSIWGSITGTLSNQTDLSTALSGKADLTGSTFNGPVSATNITSIGDFLSSNGNYRAYTQSSNTSARNWSLGQTQSFGQFDLRISNAIGGDPINYGTSIQTWTNSYSYFSGQVRSAYSSGFALVNGTNILGVFKYSGGTNIDRSSGTSFILSENGANQLTIATGGNISLSGNLTGNKATFSQGVTATNSSGDCFDADSAAGAYAFYDLSTSGTNRWRIGKDNVAESGSNAGSSIAIWGYSDAGAILGQWFTMRRSDGVFYFNGPNGFINNSQIITIGNASSNASVLLAAVAAGTAPQWVTSLPTLPNGKYPPAYWDAANSMYQGGYVCIISSKAMYQNQNNSWISVGSNSAIFGQVTAGEISANSIGAAALATNIAMTTTLKTTGFTYGTGTSAPSGFLVTGSPYTSTCLNNPNGTSRSLNNTIMEFGGNVNAFGYPATQLSWARLANGGGVQKFIYPGTYTWYCPDGIYSLTVTIQGAGGSGYGLSSGTINITGGGAGGYIKCKCSVTPRTAYTIVVGAGGASPGAGGGNGHAGGASTFNPDEGLITCGGGGGGTGQYFGAGGSVTWFGMSSVACPGFSAGNANQPGNVPMVSGGLVIGACGGACGAFNTGWMGGTQLWPSNYNACSGSGGNSCFGPGGTNTPPASTSYGAGGEGAPPGSVPGAGVGGLVMLEY
jgi:hypothetical protein